MYVLLKSCHSYIVFVTEIYTASANVVSMEDVHLSIVLYQNLQILFFNFYNIHFFLCSNLLQTFFALHSIHFCL